MRNSTIDDVINSVIDQSGQSPEFKSAFKQYIKNKFSDNSNENDLKTVLSLISIEEETQL